MGKFNSDDHLLLWARIPWKKWSSPHSQQKSLKCSTWCNLKNDKMISACFQGKPFSITVIQVYTQAIDAKEDWFYKDLQDFANGSYGEESACNVGDLGLIPG